MGQFVKGIPDPENSPNEKFEFPALPHNIREQILADMRGERIDHDLAQRLANVLQKNHERYYWQEQRLREHLEWWANIHTHPGDTGDAPISGINPGTTWLLAMNDSGTGRLFQSPITGDAWSEINPTGDWPSGGFQALGWDPVNERYMAIGRPTVPHFYTSPDGVAWTKGQEDIGNDGGSDTLQNLAAINYFPTPGIYIASGSSDGPGFWSEDGETWTAMTTDSSDDSHQSHSWDGERFVAFSNNTTAMLVSEDGKDWPVSEAITLSGNASFTGTYHNGLWIAKYSNNGIQRSFDRETWSGEDDVFSGNIVNMRGVEGTGILVTEGRRLQLTEDGGDTFQTLHSSPESNARFFQIERMGGDNQYLIAAASFNRVIRSEDHGQTWTDISGEGGLPNPTSSQGQSFHSLTADTTRWA